jgi:hypothetical protein
MRRASLWAGYLPRPEGVDARGVVRRSPGEDGRGHVRGPLRRIPNPPGRYLADPFPFEHGGRHYLFVEDYSVKNAQGVISVLESAPHGFWSHPRPVMRRDHHLSYPFVFEHDGVTYMIPETGEAGRVELHRVVDFPDTCVLERVLLDGLTAVDATVHADDGLLWLFVVLFAALLSGTPRWVSLRSTHPTSRRHTGR